jgi:hypothetical protein
MFIILILVNLYFIERMFRCTKVYSDDISLQVVKFSSTDEEFFNERFCGCLLYFNLIYGIRLDARGM